MGEPRFAVVVAGSRTFEDYDFLCKSLDKLFINRKPTAIVCGKARGADSLGERYAIEHGIAVIPFPADWNKYGKRAGYLRNVQMAENADAVVAFWDGQSRGTKHMIDIARERKLPLRIVRIPKTFP